jgi:type VI secretion system protein ImpG
VLTQPLQGLRCKVQTGYPVTLWPLEIASIAFLPPPFPAGLQPSTRVPAAAALRIELECKGTLRFADLSLDSLRFFLSDDNHVVAGLYESIFNHTLQVLLRPLDGPETLRPIALEPGECLQQVGFERDQGLLPYANQSFLGYRLLTEFFAFPPKFHFVDVCGLRRACRAGYQKRMEIVLFFDHSRAGLEQGVDDRTLRLGCAPIVNLFEQTAEPIPLTQTRHEYRLVPDVAQPYGLEVYSVTGVTSTDPTAGKTTDYLPFYSIRHGVSEESQRMFWYATRRPSAREGDVGSEVYLTLVDLDYNPCVASEATLVVRTLCTNRNLPVQLQRAGEQLLLELEGAAPLTGLRCLRSPTQPLRAPDRRGAYWRLISHLSLNHLSIADAAEGVTALQEILRLYDFSDEKAGPQLAAVVKQLIEGVTSVSSRRVVGRTGTGSASGFCRGIEVTVVLDEEKYVGTGAFLFASVLERFLGLYASVNSFSQLVARTKGEGLLHKWPPRAGEIPLL